MIPEDERLDTSDFIKMVAIAACPNCGEMHTGKGFGRLPAECQVHMVTIFWVGEEDIKGFFEM